METTKKEEEMFGTTFEVRVDLSDGFEIVKLDAGSIEEALNRASKIWNAPESVKLVGMIDQRPQEFLAW